MRALVTGANGFLGSWLALSLARRGDEVRCLVRPGGDRTLLAPALALGATVVSGDVTLPATLDPALEGAEVVFHLAGIRRASTREAFLEVNAEGTRRVAEAMLVARSRRLVLCGSLAATGPSVGGRPRVEEDPFAPEEWYGESKVEAERIAFSYSGRLEVTVCRPARILGPGDKENLTFFKLVQRGVVLKLLGPERPLSMVDVEDVVDLLLLQADRPEAVGEAFFCAADETLTAEAMMRSVADLMGRKPVVVPVPGWLLTLVGAAADVVSNATGRRLPVNRKLARQLLAPGWSCSIAKARRLLGYAPRRGLQASLRRSLESYRAAGWLRESSSKVVEPSPPSP
jgi:nucleoside-diphosphate-sugar epimerase